MRREALQGRAALAHNFQCARERGTALSRVIVLEQRYKDAFVVGVEAGSVILEGFGGGAGGDDLRTNQPVIGCASMA